MSFRKFGPTDIVLNTMRAFPNVNFLIYNSKVYYNNTPHQSGAFSDNILNITSSTSGGVSLYEYNIDRAGTTSVNSDEEVTTTGLNPPIVPYISKDSAGASFKTVGKVSFFNEYLYGDIINGNYPLTASITRQFMSPTPGARNEMINTLATSERYPDGEPSVGSGSALYPHFYALKNRLNHYRYLSEHYAVSSSFDGGWDKATEPLNIIYIPSIFYGTKINEGSLVLKYYISGTLAAELRDAKQNGELIQYSGSSADNGKVAGVVMYHEGIILLTGSWDIDSTNLPLLDGRGDVPLVKSQWRYFGAGANDGINSDTITDTRFASASFFIDFQGQTEIQVQTMFAKAHRGQVNYSNNPTFLEYNQDLIESTGSQIYEENPVRKIKNIASSSFATYNAPFRRRVYVSRVGIYDESKNLIGLATLADPLLKEDDQDYTFKIKLDL